MTTKDERDMSMSRGREAVLTVFCAAYGECCGATVQVSAGIALHNVLPDPQLRCSDSLSPRTVAQSKVGKPRRSVITDRCTQLDGSTLERIRSGLMADSRCVYCIDDTAHATQPYLANILEAPSKGLSDASYMNKRRQSCGRDSHGHVLFLFPS
ncbi:unnamed protein product [Cercospora beticola]|nr:unnamed protein product [Cercospora beticola]